MTLTHFYVDELGPVPMTRPESISQEELNEVWDEVIFSDCYRTADIIAPGEHWVDLGCHLGTFSIAAMLQGATTYMIDADVNVHHHARSNVATVSALLNGRRGGTLIGFSEGRVAEISDFNSIGAPPADGIKLDIQSAEIDLIEKEADRLAESFSKIVFEYHDSNLYGMLTTLEEAGWDVEWTRPHTDVLLNIDTHLVYATSNGGGDA